MPSTVYASGVTSTSNQPGQLQLNQDGDVLFLGTSLSNDASATVDSTVTTNNVVFSQRSGIIKPIGFVTDLGQYLTSILSLVMVICLLLVFFHFILAGLQWITSGGDKSKTEEARQRIINAFIGIIIVSASFATAGFVAYLLGVGSYSDILTTIQPIDRM